MAQVNYVLTDITYESSVNPNMKFNLTVRAYDATDQTGDTVNNRFFINGAVDGKDIMSDCLSTANQPQSNHCILRSENDWVISGDNYHLIEAMAAACEAVSIADVEETFKGEDNNDIVIAQRFSKKPDDDTVMAEVYVEGAVIWRTSFKLGYTITSYDDNDVGTNKISNASKPNLSAEVLHAKESVLDGTTVRYIVTPDPISGVYTAGRISYKYTTTWDFRAEQNEQDKLWHAYVTFSLLYGTDDVSLEFRKRDFDFSKYNLYRAEAAMQGVMDGLIDKMYDMFDKMSGVKFAVNINGDPQKPVVYENEERKILQPDDYDQLVTAFSRPKGEKNLVVEAEAAAANYDGTVRCLLQMTNGILVDKTGATWTSEGSPETTQAEAKFGYGLLLTDAARMKCGNITLGGADITVDFFAHIPSSSAAGRIFYWGDTNTFLELRYDSSEKNVIMACKEGSVSSKQDNISYGAETVCDQNFHYAITYSFANKELILFIDGVKMGAVSNVSIKRTKAEVTLGELTRDFSVTLDEFRVSDGLNRWPVPKRDPGKVVDAAGGEWLVKCSQKQNTSKTDPLDPNEPEGEVTSVTDTRFGTGIQFEPYNYIYYNTPILMGGPSSPEGDFTVDFFIIPTSTSATVGGILELVIGAIVKPSYELGFHIPGVWCVHDSAQFLTHKCTPNQEVYCAIQYNADTQEVEFYFNGESCSKKKRNGLTTESEFHLTVGRYTGNGSKGYFQGKIDQLRITKGKRLWNEENAPGGKFTPPTEPYDLESEERDPSDPTKFLYTKAFLTSAALEDASGSSAPNFTLARKQWSVVDNVGDVIKEKYYNTIQRSDKLPFQDNTYLVNNTVYEEINSILIRSPVFYSLNCEEVIDTVHDYTIDFQVYFLKPEKYTGTMLIVSPSCRLILRSVVDAPDAHIERYRSRFSNEMTSLDATIRIIKGQPIQYQYDIALNAETWHHCMICYDSTVHTVTCFINGKLFSVVPEDNVLTKFCFNIQTNTNQGDLLIIDEVRISKGIQRQKLSNTLQIAETDSPSSPLPNCILQDGSDHFEVPTKRYDWDEYTLTILRSSSLWTHGFSAGKGDVIFFLDVTSDSYGPVFKTEGVAILSNFISTLKERSVNCRIGLVGYGVNNPNATGGTGVKFYGLTENNDEFTDWLQNIQLTLLGTAEPAFEAIDYVLTNVEDLRSPSVFVIITDQTAIQTKFSAAKILERLKAKSITCYYTNGGEGVRVYDNVSPWNTICPETGGKYYNLKDLNSLIIDIGDSLIKNSLVEIPVMISSPVPESARVFTPPSEPYNAIVNEEEAFAPKEFYVPLIPYFDDSNLTAVERLPRQKEPYPEYDSLVHEPEWLYYDANSTQLEISGVLSGINAQTYYAFFEPKAGYCWRDGSTAKKRVPWYIRKVGVGQMPRQDEPLVYNATEQDVNLVNFNAATMVLSGRVRAMVANTIDTPYYYCTVTLKDNLAWPTGTTEPYEVPWEIVPQPVVPPVLSETSSLEFVYNGTEQGPVFVYNSDLIAVKGDVKAVDANVTDAGIVLTEEYCVTFSLKDTQNYCWNTTETEFDISDTEDISFFWHIKRRVIQQPSWSGGPFVYNGTEQGPTVEGLDEAYCQISGHRATEPGYYTARVVLTDPDNCEWPDGTTGDVVYNWEIPMQKGQISLVPNTLNLQAHKGTPVPSATVQVTRLGSGKVIVTEHPKVRVEIDNTTLTVYGLDTTYPNSVTLSVSVETGHGFDYSGVSAPLTITVLRWLDALTWQEIAELATEDELLNGYSFIGDSKAVPSCYVVPSQQCNWSSYKKSSDYSNELTNPYCRTVLVGVDHNAAYEGDGRAHFLFYNNADNSLGYLKADASSMHSGKTIFTGGWRNSNIRTRYQSFAQYDVHTNTLPDDMIQYTVPVLKWTDNIGNGVNNKDNVFPTLEWLSSFSEKEVFGTNTYSNEGEDTFQERYAYFSLNPGDIARTRYDGDTNAVLVALRSPNATDTGKDIFSDTNGVLTSNPLTGSFASDGRASLLLFTVANKRPDNLSIPSIDQHMVSLLHCDVESSNPLYVIDVCKGLYKLRPKVNNLSDLLKDTVVTKGSAGYYNWLAPVEQQLPFADHPHSLCMAGNYVMSSKPFVLNGSDITVDLFFGYSNQHSSINHNCDAFLFTLKSESRAIRVYVKNNILYCNLIDKYSDTASDQTVELTALTAEPVKYHHCALQCKEGKLYLYVNGKGQEVSSNYSVKKDLYTFYLGADPLLMIKNSPELSLSTTVNGQEAVFDFHLSEIRILDGISAYNIPANSGAQAFTAPTARFSDTAYLAYDHTIEGVHLSLSSTEPVKTLNVLQHSGPLFVHSSAPDIVAAYTGHDNSLNCDTVTLEGVSAGTATVTIYTKDTALTYGDIRTIEVTCDTSIAFKTLANCQPSEIRSIVKKGSATKAWVLGDKTADISLSGTVNGKQISQTVKATIIGFDHNKQKESNGQFSVHLMLDPIEDTFVMNDETVTEGGWKSSKMRNTTCAEIYAALPAAWKSVVTPCTKYSDNNGTIDIDDAISSTEDNIWILSNYEVTGTVIASGHTITAFEGEYQKQYDYFKTAVNQPSDTWLRTPEIKGTTFVSQGVPTKTVFCFMISDYSAAELLPDNLCSFSDNNSVEYDGNMHYPEEDGIVRYLANAEHPTLYRQYYTFSGDISAQKSGYYFLRIKPAPGYLWNDGTATEVPVAWTILPADSTITPDKESLRAYCKNNYQDSVAISRKATTTLEVTGYDTSLISVTVNNNRVTVTALATGKTEITITSPTDGNYKTVSVALPVTASKVGELASLTPAQIQAAVIAGYAPLAWDPGDVTAPITVSGMFAGQDISGFYRAFILSCEHNTKNEGKHLHLCLGKEREGNKIIAFGKISLGSTNGGWQNSVLRTQIQGLTTCFPKAWRDVITNVCTKYNNTNVSGQSNTTRDKIWLLAQEEIFSYPNNNIKQYDYFAYGNKAVAYRQDYPSVIATLGTRTVAATAPGSWVGVNIQGKETVIPPTQKVALLPCFAIGTTKESPGLTVNPESIVTKVGDTVNVTVIVSAGLPFTVTGYDEEIISVDAATCTVSALSIGRTYIVISTEETDTYAQDSVTIPVTVAAADKTDPVVTFSNSILNVWKNNTAPLTIDVTGGDIFSVTSEDITVATVMKKGSYYSVAGINDGNTNIVVDIRGDLSHNNVIKKIPVHVGAQPVTLSTLTEAASNLLINNPTYNGQEWNLTRDDIIAGYNQRYHALSGDITATNHSPTDYSVQVTPQVGFQWFDKTTETKNLPWNVNKATGILSGTDVVVLTKTTRETVAETYTITEGSTLSVKNNSHSSLVTVTVNGNKATFTSSCSSNATANVTLQVSETNNYTSTELTVEVTVRDSALEVIPAIAGKDKLSVSKVAVTYDKNTTLTVDSSWIANFSNDYHRITKVAKYADNTETVINNKKIKDAGTYRIYVSPAAGCAWDNTNDVDPVKLEYVINRKPIAVADEPVQSTTITLKTTGSTMPTADDFDYYKDQCIPATPFCSSQTTAGTFTGEDGAFFIPTSNYCWSDGSTEAKSFPWTISSLVLLAKPTITTTSFVYDGTEKDPGIITPDGMATYVTVTMQHKAPIACADPILYSSDTVLAEKEKASGIKEELIDDAIPVYRQTNAGTYIFTFIINDNHTASWSDDSSTDSVILEYTINRTEIAEADEPKSAGEQPVSWEVTPGDIFPTVKPQDPVFTVTTEANVGTNKKYTKGDISQQYAPGTYTAQFLVNGNYKWRKITNSDDPFVPREIPWKIVKADGFITIDTVHNKSLTNFDYERSAVTQSSSIESAQAKQGAFKLIEIDNKALFQILQTGTTVASVTVAESNNFKQATVDLEFELTLVRETANTAMAFIHNLMNALVWQGIQDGEEAMNSALSFSTNGKITTLSTLNSTILQEFQRFHSSLTGTYGYQVKSDGTIGVTSNYQRINDGLDKLATSVFGLVIDKRWASQSGASDVIEWKGTEVGSGSLLGADKILDDITYADVVPEEGNLKPYPNPLTQTIDTTEVDFPAQVANATSGSLDYYKNWVVQASYTWWILNSLKIIKDVFGFSLDSPHAEAGEIQTTYQKQVKKDGKITYEIVAQDASMGSYTDNSVSFAFFTEASENGGLTAALCRPRIGTVESFRTLRLPNNDKIDSVDVSYTYQILSKTKRNRPFGIMIEVNTEFIKGGCDINNKNGKFRGYDDALLDAVLLHELLHGVCDVNVQSYYSKTLPVWFSEGIAELLPGVDESRGLYLSYLVDGNPDVIKKFFGGSIQEGIEVTKAEYNSNRVAGMSYYIASFILGYLFKRSKNGDFADNDAPTPVTPTPGPSSTTVTKPTVSSSTFTYDGSPVSITVPNNIMTVANVTMKKKLPLTFSYAASVRLKVGNESITLPYNLDDKSTTGFDSSFTDIELSSSYNFKETNAGVYQLTFTLKDTATTKWADNTTAPVTVEFTINRAAITTTDKPVLSPTDYTYNGQAQTPTCAAATTANLDKKYTMEVWEESAVNTTEDPNYTAFFFPTMNYKWGFSVYSKDPFGFEALPWYIVASDNPSGGGGSSGNTDTVNYPHLRDPNNVNTEWYPANPSFEINLTTTEEGFSKTLYCDTLSDFKWSVNVPNSDIIKVKTNGNLLTISCFKYGTYELKWKIKKATGSGVSEGSIPVNCNPVFVTVEQKKPWTFITNFLRCLVWGNTAWYIGDYNYSSGKIVNVYPIGGIQSLDDAVNIVTHGELKSTQAVLDKMKEVAGTFTASNVNNVFKEQYGMDLENTDIGTLWGFDMGASNTQIGMSDVVPETGSVESAYPSGPSLIEGVKFVWPDQSTLTDKQNFIIRALDTWWIKNALVLIKQYYNLVLKPAYNTNFTAEPEFKVVFKDTSVFASVNSAGNYHLDNAAIVKDGYFVYGNNWEYKTAAPSTNSNYWGQRRVTSWQLEISNSIAEKINMNSDGTISGNVYPADQAILHEMVHGVIFSNIHGHMAQPKWFRESIADLMIGNDFRSDLYKTIAKSSTRLQQIYEERYQDENDPYAFGVLMMKYLIKHFCIDKTVQPSAPT